MRKAIRLLGLIGFFFLTGISAKAVDVPVIVAKLEGSSSQLVAGAQAQVNIYSSLSFSGISSVNRITNAVTFKINEESSVFLGASFSASITYKIYFEDGNGVLDSTAVKTLSINYDTSSRYTSRSSYKFSGAYKATVKIISVTAPANILPVLMVLNEMYPNVEYNFNCTIDTVTGLGFIPSFSQADELYVSWNPLAGSDEYDLEWSYVDSTALQNYVLNSALNSSLLFRENSSRVSITDSTHYKIPLLYDHGGALFFRVRGIRNKASGFRTEGKWTWGQNRYGFYGHERRLNWQATTSYAEEGKRKSVVQYFDGSLRGRQTVTKDNSLGTTVVAETFYDYQGRPVINVLPAPTLSTIVKYSQNFNTGLNGAEYDKSRYDTLISANAYCGSYAQGMGTTSGASRYYSSNNPESGTGFHQFIPDANNYPFVETVYEQDNTGRIARQSGVGDTHRLGNGHETRYFYGLPSQKELDGLFGTEVGNYTHYQKNMVQDANGQYSVSYVDMNGRTIATALAGQAPPSLERLESNNVQTVTEPLITPSSNITDGLSMIAFKGLLVPEGGPHRFVYSLLPDSLSLASCNAVNICYDCYYDLEITITNDCNNAGLPANKPLRIVRTNLTPASLDIDCTNQNFFPALDTTVNLVEGSYLITKKLTASRWAMEYYRDSVFLRNNTCRTKESFIRQVLDSMRLQPSNCYPECTSCLATVGTWPSFHQSYMAQSGYSTSDTAAHRQEAETAYKNALDVCASLCNSAGDDVSIRRSMLWDVSPSSGQYANPHPDSANAYSIFYVTGGTPRYANPVLVYRDENGKPDTVYVNGQPVLPQALSPQDFAARFKPSWAEALLPYHPEFCKLQKYELYSPSHSWDRRFEDVETYADAKAAGFLNPTGGNTLPFSAYPTANQIKDPLFDKGYTLGGNSIKSLMEQRMAAYKQLGSSGTISMWALATVTSVCDKDETACTNTYSSDANAFNETMLCQGELDMAWRSFRSFYLEAKRDFVRQLIDGCPPVSLGYYQERFILPSNYLDPSFSGEANETANAQNGIAANYVANCEAYAEQWLLELSNCKAYDTADLRLQVLPKLIQVCIKGSDATHPYGSSTIAPDSTYTYNSFEAVLQWYNNLKSLNAPQTNFCNAYLITAPKPYNQPTVYGEIPIWNKPDSCTCARISELYASYQANTASFTNFSHYLAAVHHTNISQGALDTLRGLCSGAITCNFLAQPINLPATLQCGTVQTCINCEQMRNGYAAFTTLFPGAVPGVDTAQGDTTQVLVNTVFANFLNAQFGFSYSVAEYLAFMRECGIGLTPYGDTLWKRMADFRRYYTTTPQNNIWRSWKISSFTTSYMNTLNALLRASQGRPLPTGYGIRPPSFNKDQKLRTITSNPGYYYYDPNYSIVFPAPLQHTLSTATTGAIGLAHLNSNVVKPSDFVSGTATFEDLKNRYYAVVTRTRPLCFQNIWNGTGHSPGAYLYYSVPTPDSTFTSQSPSWSGSENHIQTVAFYRPGISVSNPATYWTFHNDSVYRNTYFHDYYNTAVPVDQIKAIRDVRFDPAVLPIAGLTDYEWNSIGLKVTLDLTNNTQTDAYIYSSYSYPETRYKEFVDSNLYNPNCKLAFAYYFNQQGGTSYSSTQIDSIYIANGITFNYCNAGPDTTRLLCGKKEVFPFIDPNSSNCEDSTNMATVWGTELYNAYQDSLKTAFENAYLKKCLNALNLESFTVERPHSEYHYTLYYYDQAGNLVKTVPPAGVVNKIGDAAFLTAVKNARVNSTSHTPAHTLVTDYRYNTLNQVVAQNSLDGGTSHFWYDRLGRLAISQNAKQAGENNYSYTLYDGLGRITEVGQAYSSAAMTDVTSQSASALAGWVNNSSRSQITRTVYDLPDTNIEPELFQKNLRNRASYTSYTDADGNDLQSATYYSYDIHGNVDTLLQDYRQGFMSDRGNRFKKLVYRYDLISGKVNHVAYQPGRRDAFYHRYRYDAENKLTEVYTSRDSLYWEQEAAYSYYKHGPLARTELGQQRVQGLDYAYTIQGWLKGVNGTLLCEGRNDMGQDGDVDYKAGRFVARDELGFALHYFDDDYKAIGDQYKFRGVTMSVGSRIAQQVNYYPLFNGNISAMTVNIGKLAAPAINNYRYDQLNRIKGMEFLPGNNNCEGREQRELWDFEGPSRDGSYDERVSYDANGNILSYLRNGTGNVSLEMDALEYHYNYGNNQLTYITDKYDPNLYNVDIDEQNDHNYQYDAIGNLIFDEQSYITDIRWTVYGKIADIQKNGDPTGVERIYYTYDASGNRISKTVYNANTGVETITWYVRDASGNVMAVYEEKEELGGLALMEQHLYGSSRLGVEHSELLADPSLPERELMGSLGYVGYPLSFERGRKQYELSNHLGNVLVTISDKKMQHDENGNEKLHWYSADVLNASDYYPFGMLMPGRSYASKEGYRYGFNGKEQDNEVKGEGNQQDYGMRIYDPRVARFLSVDPLTKNFPFYTPYQFAGNKPISNIDLDGEEDYHYTFKVVRQTNGWTVFTVKFDKELNTDWLSKAFRLGMDESTYHLRLEGTDINNGIRFNSYSEMFAAAKRFSSGEIDFNTSKKAQADQDFDNFLAIAAADLASNGHATIDGYITNKITTVQPSSAVAVGKATKPSEVASQNANTSVSNAKPTPGPKLKTAGGKTITNSKWADQLNPNAFAKGFNVPVQSSGYPDFSRYLYTKIPEMPGVARSYNTVNISMTGTYSGDFAAANRQAGFRTTPDGYTWHHTEKVGELQLIQSEAHDAARHSGGVQLYREQNGGRGYR